jgi:16S rRNA (adenine1518-N6/adenine1519-N6)-dimethyltransferase
VIANIPYYITSPILRHFLYNIPNTPENMVIMMQKDVANKIIGGKKDKTSVLRLLIEKKSCVSEKLFVPKESFFPVPKIESSVLLFQPHKKYEDVDDALFLELIKK